MLALHLAQGLLGIQSVASKIKTIQYRPIAFITNHFDERCASPLSFLLCYLKAKHSLTSHKIHLHGGTLKK
jgi:hypothetical protein